MVKTDYYLANYNMMTGETEYIPATGFLETFQLPDGRVMFLAAHRDGRLWRLDEPSTGLSVGLSGWPIRAAFEKVDVPFLVSLANILQTEKMQEARRKMQAFTQTAAVPVKDASGANEPYRMDYFLAAVNVTQGKTEYTPISGWAKDFLLPNGQHITLTAHKEKRMWYLDEPSTGYSLHLRGDSVSQAFDQINGPVLKSLQISFSEDRIKQAQIELDDYKNSVQPIF